MKKLNSMLSLIAMMVAVIVSLPSGVSAECHQCNQGTARSTQKCSVIGCGTIGKCGRCRQKERQTSSSCDSFPGTTNSTPTAAPALTQPLPIGSVVQVVDPIGESPVNSHAIADMSSLQTHSESDLRVASLPTCGVPSSIAPAPSCSSSLAGTSYLGDTSSTCDSNGRGFSTKSCSQFYQAHSECDGCGGYGCSGGCDSIAMSTPRSCNTDVASLSGAPIVSTACSCGSCSCDGSCYGDIEMTFAEKLWADVCCEPYRSNYCSLFGGFGEIEDFYPTEVIPSRGSFDDGWIAGISKGRYLTKCLRAELEYTFREGNADDLVVGGVPSGWDGELQVHALMFNAVFQLNYGPMAYISPYYGAGVGVAFFDSDIDGLGGNLSLEEAQLAWQGLFGVNVALSQGIDLFGEYRIMRTSELELEDSISGAALGTTDPEFNTYLVGLRFYR